MLSKPVDLSSTLVNHIFTDQGPRGPWESMDGQRMKKVLGAGLAGLSQYPELTNRFLTTLNLPKAIFISQPEFEGTMKRYFLLEISKTDWEEKIAPIAQSPQRLAEIKSTADNIINSLK